jgi:hypothetical protein
MAVPPTIIPVISDLSNVTLMGVELDDGYGIIMKRGLVEGETVPWLGQAVIIKSGVGDAVALVVGVTEG